MVVKSKGMYKVGAEPIVISGVIIYPYKWTPKPMEKMKVLDF